MGFEFEARWVSTSSTDPSKVFDNSLSESFNRWMACFVHWVQPCIARKESALQEAHPFILIIISTNPAFSGELSPLFSTRSTNFFQVAPRRSRSEGIILGGNNNSVSALYILMNFRFFNYKGRRRGLYSFTCNLSTQKIG